jgi:riboflavin kinase/FMN adenylyltransferase
MQLIQSIEEIERPFANAVITIGNFDGVHIGHQALLHTVIERADAINGTSVAMTFEPHPLRVLTNNDHPPLITIFEQKAELIASAGIDVLVCVPFTREFAAVSAESFVEDLLIAKIGVKAIVVGRDYTFGRGRKGNIAMLEHYHRQGALELVAADWIQNGDPAAGRISSTRVRQLVEAGDMAGARKMLGRYYQIRGRVIEGRDRGGKVLGYPTANIALEDELTPKTGIYAVTVAHDGEIYPAVANIGYSPTFDDHIFTVEVHILDFESDIYGQPIRINFVKRLRDEAKFTDIGDLITQIEADIDQARQILAR